MNLLKSIKSTIPELPDKKKERLIKEFGINNYDAEVIVSDKATSNYFEAVALGRNSKLAVTWITGELFCSFKQNEYCNSKKSCFSRNVGATS